MFSSKYIFSYQEIVNILSDLCNNHNDIITKQRPIGYSSFGFPIDYYKLGKGKKDVILIAATHGTELVTVTFILKFIFKMINESSEYSKYLNEYTFHIIPILNPEGYIISSSNVLHNTKDMDIDTLESYAKRYVRLYDQDDINSAKKVKCIKLYKALMNTSTLHIPYLSLRINVDRILKECKLDSRVLPVWSSNGMGIDINANSIHKFAEMKKYKNKSKCGKLRYNDIPVNKPSPHGFPGDKPFDKRCPENLSLFNFVNGIYKKGNLKLFISYHSTGSEIYGYPEEDCVTERQYDVISKGIDYYKFMTNYTPINEKMKYGVMDFYRISLENTVTLTVELSKANGNPIGPFSNIKGINNEFANNISSIFYTLDCIKKNIYN